MVVVAACLALAFGAAVARAGATAAASHAPTATAASTFVSQYPLDDADQLDCYSLATGRRLGCSSACRR